MLTWGRHRCVGHVLERVAEGRAELMVATHNQASVEQAVAAMQRLGVQPGATSGKQRITDEPFWM